MKVTFRPSHLVRLLLGLSFALGGCKGKTAVSVPLVLLAPVTITPASSTIQRGDTLWLSANFSDSLTDFNSGHHYRLQPKDMVLAMGIVIKELQGIGQTATGSASTFRVVEQVGQLAIGGVTTGVFALDYDGHFYKGKFGLIPTQPGVMSISLLLSPDGGPKGFGRYIPFIQLPPNADGQEQKATLDDMFFIINEGKANNYSLYSQHTTAYPQLPAGVSLKNSLYEQQSTFTVEVK